MIEAPPVVRAHAHGVLDGLRAPLIVLQKARAAGFLPDYLRYVRKQLVVVILAMAAIGPMFLGSARRSRHLHAARTVARIASRTKPAPPHAKSNDDAEEPVEDAANKVEDAANKVEDAANAAADDASEAPDENGFFARHFPWLFSLWIWLAAAYGTWLGVEWTVAFLWKDYGDVVSDELSRAIGQASQTPPLAKPRVRIDLTYLRLKVRRTIHNALMFASGAPFFALAQKIPVVGNVMASMLLAVWTVYWWMVTTAAKSELAWTTPATRSPWFLRAWDYLTSNVFGFRWFLPRWYGRIWHRITKKLHPAALIAEDSPAEILGLSIVRILGDAPLLSIAVRPLLPISTTTVAARGQNLGPANSA